MNDAHTGYSLGQTVRTPDGVGKIVRVYDYGSKFRIFVRTPCGNANPYAAEELELVEQPRFRAFPQDVSVGDYLEPNPHWNKSTGDTRRHLPSKTKVEAVRRANCDTGILVTVKAKSGLELNLSAAWFTGFANNPAETSDR